MPVACTEVLLLSSILQRRIEVGEDVCGTPEVCGGDLAEVDGMVPGLHLADHAAFQVGECLVEEWGPCLSRVALGAVERSVLRLEVFGAFSGLVVRAHDAGNIEAVRDGLEDLTARLLFHSRLPLRNSFRSNRPSLGQMPFYMSAFQHFVFARILMCDSW